MPPYRGNRNRRIQNPRFAEDKILQMLVAGEGGFNDPTIRRGVGGLPTVDELEEIAAIMRLKEGRMADRNYATADLFRNMRARNLQRARSSGPPLSPERELSILEVDAAVERGMARNPDASSKTKLNARHFLKTREPRNRKELLKALAQNRKLAPLLLLAALVGGAGLAGGSESA